MKLKSSLSGYLAVYVALWSLFPVLSAMTVEKIGFLSGIALTSLASGLFLGIFGLFGGDFKNFWQKPNQKELFISILIFGFLYFGLNFAALAATSAGNMALLDLLKVPFGFLLLSFFMKAEKFAPKAFLGAMIMCLGAAIPLFQSAKIGFSGDFIVVLAAIIASIGNQFSKKATESFSPVAIMGVRSTIVGLSLTIFLFFSGNLTLPSDFWTIFIIFFNGIFVFSLSAIAFLRAIKLSTVSFVQSFGAFLPISTFLMAYLFQNTPPTRLQLISLPILILGLLILVRNKPK